LSEQDQREIFEETAGKRGLSIAAIEKDWWVVQTLSVIFSLKYAHALIFKGGTSLSKGWNLVQRFSEDIDLALDREFLGFTGELSKGDIKKLRRKSYQFITEIFTEELKIKFSELDFKNVLVKNRKVENHDQDPLTVEIYYPNLINKDSYLKPAILVEVGSRSLKEPFTQRSFGTIISEVFTDRPFADKPISIPVVNPERTFLEKIFLLHEEFQKPQDKIRVERLSRHLYDIEKLSQTEYAQAAFRDTKLYNTIVRHREKFTPISGIDYTNHSPDKICFIPPETILKDWQLDYEIMTQTMIYDNPLPFDELITSLTKLQRRINQCC
jgi:predicted nucleotidyltransferase component of viral defense system